MTDTLRTLIESTLADASGLCLDNPDDRAMLTGALLGALRPEMTEPVLILQVNGKARWDDVRPAAFAYHRSVYAAVDCALANYDYAWLWRVADADGCMVASCKDAWVADRRRTLRGTEARSLDGDGPYPVRPATEAEPPSPALVNEDGGPEYQVAEMWRGEAEPPSLSPEYEPLDVPAVLAHWGGEWAYLVEMTVQQAIEGTHDADEVRDCLIVENAGRKAAQERADNAEWAVGELRAALEGLLEEPEIERRYCPRCGKSLDQRPVRHAAGCPVQRAEDALRDTADVGELARKLAAEREAHRALVEAARELCEAAKDVNDNAGTPHGRPTDWLTIHDDYVTDLARAAEDCRDALAALEGKSE